MHHACPFKGEPWGEDFTRLRIELEYRYGDKGTQQFIEVLLLFSKYPQQQVKDAVRQCVRLRSFSADAVNSVLNYIPPQQANILDLSQHPLLQIGTDGIRKASEYDLAFFGQEGIA